MLFAGDLAISIAFSPLTALKRPITLVSALINGGVNSFLVPLPRRLLRGASARAKLGDVVFRFARQVIKIVAALRDCFAHGSRPSIISGSGDLRVFELSQHFLEIRFPNRLIIGGVIAIFVFVPPDARKAGSLRGRPWHYLHDTDRARR